MKLSYAVWVGVVALGLLVPSTLGDTNRIPVMLVSDGVTTTNLHLLWQSEPGVRYRLDSTTNLSSGWTNEPGYPVTAQSMSQEHIIAATNSRGFYRIGAIDEQPPVVVVQYPAADGFAVGRFADVFVQLTDATGIDPASIRLTVGGIGPVAPGAEGLSVSNDTVMFDSGAIALGDWGATINATLIAADSLGNTLTNTWSFRLETEPVVTNNVFVFGSPPAQVLGQRVRGPTAALAVRYPPGPMPAALPPGTRSTWSIELVDSNRVVLAYADGGAPTFDPGQLVCNLTPASTNEIFYRRVGSVSNDAAASRLTLFTTDALLTDFAQQGAAALSEQSVILDFNTNGVFVSSIYVGATLTFPRMGLDLSGTEFNLREDGYEIAVWGVTYSLGTEPDWLHVTLPECSWWLTPRIQAGLELDRGGMKSFEAIAQSDVAIASVIEADVVLVGLSAEKKLFDVPVGSPLVLYVGQIGPVPVFATLGVRVGLKAEGEAKAQVSLTGTYRQEHSSSFGLVYDRDSGLEWVNQFQGGTPDLSAEAALTGELSVHMILDPRIEFLVYAAAGLKAGIEPSVGFVTTVPIIGGAWDGKFEAGVDFVLGTAGPLFDLLDFEEKLELNLWHGEWPLTAQTLEFTTQPQSLTVSPGDPAAFSCTVASSSPATYQWYHKELPIPGQINRSLFLPRVNAGHAGVYRVRASAGELSANSDPATLAVQTPTPLTQDTDGDGIPDLYETNTGVWQSTTNRGTNPLRGDSDGDGLSDGVETHTGIYRSRNDTGTDPNRADTDGDGVNDKREIDLGTDPNLAPAPAGMVYVQGGTLPDIGNGVISVSSFMIGKYEVTWTEWQTVRAEAGARGYDIGAVGDGCAGNHPAHSMTWYDVVKWCNLRSEIEGRTPVYRVGGNVYKSGWRDDVTVTGSANGYRLPTDAEWEFAARGGTQSQGYEYSGGNDLNTVGWYGDNSGGAACNYWDSRGTWPVGQKGANELGLHDMSGNVWEWCFDWYPGYEGSARVGRGGSWAHSAGNCRVALRSGIRPAIALRNLGFRAVLPPGQ